MRFLKNHPFAVEAQFDSSIVLTYAVPKEQLKSLIPAHLELETFQDHWAFIAIAMVQTKDLRPKGFPRFLGNDFYLIGYRIFVRYVNKSGKKLRGLFIIKSETDKLKMQILGNIFTHYNYSTTDIAVNTVGNQKSIISRKSKFEIIIESANGEIKLPEGSPFPDWKDARKFAGPLPFTFYCDAAQKTILTVEGKRQNWIPNPIRVIRHNIDFINKLNLKDAVLANAFEINDISYYWKKGLIERWA